MKILYLTQRVPYPPNRGDRIPTFNHIRILSENHEVYIATLLENRSEIEDASALKKWAREVVWEFQGSLKSRIGQIIALLKGMPISLGHFSSHPLKLKVARLIRKNNIEAAVIFSSSMAQYVRDFPGIIRIMNFCDMDSQKWAAWAEEAGFFKRVIFARESQKLLQYEKQIAQEFNISCVVTQKEADTFHQLIPEQRVEVIENGVDCGYFGKLPRNPQPCELCFVGVMDYFPNTEAVIWFIKKVWPGIKRSRPDAEFKIVGSEPSGAIRALGNLPGISVTGKVEDVRPYLATASLTVLPMRLARGIQNKILEAMSAGTPILTTLTTLQGLHQDAQKHVWVENRVPGPFLDKLLYILARPEEAEARARGAAEFVRSHYSWREKTGRLEKVILDQARKAGS